MLSHLAQRSLSSSSAPYSPISTNATSQHVPLLCHFTLSSAQRLLFHTVVVRNSLPYSTSHSYTIAAFLAFVHSSPSGSALQHTKMLTLSGGHVIQTEPQVFTDEIAFALSKLPALQALNLDSIMLQVSAVSPSSSGTLSLDVLSLEYVTFMLFAIGTIPCSLLSLLNLFHSIATLHLDGGMNSPFTPPTLSQPWRASGGACLHTPLAIGDA